MAARRAASGPVRECAHRVARHVHGSNPAYVLDRCRCRPCMDARAAYERGRARQRAYGRACYVDAGRARAHVEALRGQGLGLKRIAAVSGVPNGGLSKLMYGDRSRGMKPSARIRPTTEAKILGVAVTVDRLGRRVAVDGVGTRRRLRALMAIGWHMSELARRLGRSPTNFTEVVNGRRPVCAGTAVAVRALYDELSMTPPVQDTPWGRARAARARNWARCNGWLPPLAWDDESIDDPDATGAPDVESGAPVVDAVAVARAAAGDRVRLTVGERDAAFAFLVAKGYSVTEAGRRLGLSGSTCQEIRRRLTSEVTAAAGAAAAAS